LRLSLGSSSGVRLGLPAGVPSRLDYFESRTQGCDPRDQRLYRVETEQAVSFLLLLLLLLFFFSYFFLLLACLLL
jgi:hypothetical protein